MAMTIADLLGDGAQRGQKIVDTVKPALTKEEYLKMLRSFNNVELFSEE
jgi:hypothetical protein